MDASQKSGQTVSVFSLPDFCSGSSQTPNGLLNLRNIRLVCFQLYKHSLSWKQNKTLNHEIILKLIDVFYPLLSAHSAPKQHRLKPFKQNTTHTHTNSLLRAFNIPQGLWLCLWNPSWPPSGSCPTTLLLLPLWLWGRLWAQTLPWTCFWELSTSPYPQLFSCFMPDPVVPGAFIC